MSAYRYPLLLDSREELARTLEAAAAALRELEGARAEHRLLVAAARRVRASAEGTAAFLRDVAPAALAVPGVADAARARVRDDLLAVLTVASGAWCSAWPLPPAVVDACTAWRGAFDGEDELVRLIASASEAWADHVLDGDGNAAPAGLSSWSESQARRARWTRRAWLVGLALVALGLVSWVAWRSIAW